MVRRQNIPVAAPNLSGNEEKYLINCVKTSWISSKGQYIERFENNFARFVGSTYAVSSSNGTTALHLALLALGIGRGDEVIIPDLTFVASANTVRYTGAKPVLTDVNRQTWNIDITHIKDKITKRTKAIMPVHLYGQPADMNELADISKHHHLYIVEDAAEAHGAEIRLNNKSWRKVGSIGDVGVFSFYGNKIITTGEGGMVVTNRKDIASKIRILRDHGQNPQKRYFHDVIGYNYRMTNMQAAVGCAQLERIDKFLEIKRHIAKLYNQYLSGIPGITLPTVLSGVKSVYWMYSVIVDKPYPETRDNLMRLLMENGIESRPFFYPIHDLPPYKEKKHYPNSEYLSEHGLNLPSSVLLTDNNIEMIADVIKKAGR